MYSPSWAAPEQLAGQPVNASTDIYSLAVVAIYMMTGKAIFAEEDVYAGYKKRRQSEQPIQDAMAAVGAPRALIALLTAGARVRSEEADREGRGVSPPSSRPCSSPRPRRCRACRARHRGPMAAPRSATSSRRPYRPDAGRHAARGDTGRERPGGRPSEPPAAAAPEPIRSPPPKSYPSAAAPSYPVATAQSYPSAAAPSYPVATAQSYPSRHRLELPGRVPPRATGRGRPESPRHGARAARPPRRRRGHHRPSRRQAAALAAIHAASRGRRRAAPAAREGLRRPPVVQPPWMMVAGVASGAPHRIPLSDMPHHVGDRTVHFARGRQQRGHVVGTQAQKVRVTFIQRARRGRVLHVKGMTCFVAHLGGRPSPPSSSINRVISRS